MLEEHSPSHLPLALSSFCRSEGMTPPLPLYSPTPSTLHNPFESLTILDHISRNSHTVPFDSATPPLSPSHDAYLELYPVPPHLTPHPSPTQSRAQSPTQWYHHDHEPLPSTSLLGALTILVIEARGLSVTGREKPYVLLQYDRTESVSREFGAGEIPPLDSSKRKKAGLGGRSKSTSFSGPRGIVTTRRGGDTTPSPGNVMNGGRIVNDEIPTGDVEEIGTSANPIWNHCAKFDVVQPGRTILLCVYDKLADIASPTHGFLGASVFEPDLIPDPGEDGLGFEIWVPLQSALDPHLGGEVRLKILFETPKFQPKMCVDDFQVLQRIGEGSFGQVFRVKKRDTKRIYAMKVITKKSVRSSSALSQVLAERAVLARTLDSPFLVGLKFSFQSATELFFVIDYKSGGELFTHLQRDGGRFEEVKVRFYLCEIILALEYLHAHSIIYRDLKPENILLDGSGHIVLVDFGLSKLLGSCDELTKTMCGTTAFMAPEVLLDVGYNYRADWWSTGVLMYEMLFGFSPFYAETPVEEYERILGGEIKIADRRGHSPETRDLLARFLTRDPDSRLGANGGASEIKAHPFFASIDWVKCALRQISPPFKPRISADLDCEYHDAGRSFGDWVFSDGACFQVPSARNSMLVPTKDLDLEGDFRNFTFTSLFEDDSKPKVRSVHERRSSYNGAP